MRYKTMFLWALAGAFALALGVYSIVPGTLGYFVEEDSLIENLTAFSYFLTMVVAVAMVRKRPGCRRYLLFIAVIGLLGALDELSFGERLFSLPMPKIGEWKVDGVHDLFYVAYKSMKNFSRAHGYVFYPTLVVSIAIIMWTMVKYRDRIASRLGFYAHREFFHLFYIACALVLFALLIDIHMFKGEVAFILEEMSELMSAYAMIAACFALPKGTAAG